MNLYLVKLYLMLSFPRKSAQNYEKFCNFARRFLIRHADWRKNAHIINNLIMRKFLFAALSAAFCLVSAVTASAQASRNNSADGIIGHYFIDHNGEQSKVKAYKEADGTYTFQNYWSRNMYDKDGNIYKDTKNPDKSLRDTPCNEMKIMWNLVYNAEKKVWKGKIYDPTRGLRADATVKFTDDGRLSVKGSVLGIGMTVYWKPIPAED